jgi:hypothetical protein
MFIQEIRRLYPEIEERRKLALARVAKRACLTRSQRYPHGCGRNERGRLDHTNAGYWVLRSPRGVVYTFMNLREWARHNQDLFCDVAPASRLPLSYRIAAGLHMAVSRRPHYQGWVVVSRIGLVNRG